MDSEPAHQSSPQDEADPDKAQDAKDAPSVPLRERVRQQRRHIEGLTGQDPLRAGIDD
ncbi:MAG: hypothetical protein Q7V15_05335 [Phenylobacterium sp.]|uniref:hypothetical protein n=1 Tax=Phenylobacterium sp. TaxID=1871053 RepID=UPI00271F9C1F|nr:hypothetical protein [Phenylobacterium sp.]MDO8900760.1 hypothetical protein [Phenylobacterium sp.]